MGRYRRLRGLYGRLLLSFDRIGAQSKDDAERFIELGARRDVVVVTGNIKFDLPEPTTDTPGLRRRFGIDADRPVVAAGSTGPGEEEIVLRTYSTLRARLPRTFLVLAPRHVERVREVLGVASSMKIGLHRLSSRSDAEAGGADGLLVDTLGELVSLYPMADAAFVGGSLVPVGGHNLLEPAAAGVPVVFGPHVHHVAEMAQTLLRAGAAVQVSDGAGLESAWYRILTDRAARTSMIVAARETVLANRGALARTADLVEELLGDGAGSMP
jgi:3-deoxy-D-manno-octulosonic-acid transferase